MLERTHYLQTIRERLDLVPIVALLGPRQAGKTTLARTFADSVRTPVHHFDLESTSDLARLQNAELTLSPLEGLIILDEIQRLPELYPVLRVLADRPEQKAQFLILGSASPKLVAGVSETLAGRISFIDVSGFSLDELPDSPLETHWWRGGFPRAFLAKRDELARQWHEDFFRTFLERDIPQLGITVPSTTMRRFWTMIAHYHGQTLQTSELARSLGVSEPTTKKYLDILSGTYVVRQLPPWFENLKKRQVKAPKIYVRDSGVCHALLGIPDRDSLPAHPKVGASWEGYAIEQILAVTGDREAYFWATHAGAELDLLLFHKGKRLGFEFKYSENPKTTKSMRVALQDLALDHLYVVHPGEHSFPLDEMITAVSLPDVIEAVAAN